MNDRGAALLEQLDAQSRALVLRCGTLAGERDERAFLVGGSVRDLILERAADDLDVVVEGDGLAVAQALSRALDGSLTRHHAFQTAVVSAPDGSRIDVATARREDYRRPGQLPQVVPGSLEDDLQRRDFRINTMAISLTGDAAGCFIDPLDGAADLEKGIVRVLHSRSFADDPTRILRALRFALRFAFDLEAETHALLLEAVNGGYLDTVSGARIRRELAYMFRESPLQAPVRLEEEGVLQELHADLVADPTHLGELHAAIAWYRDLATGDLADAEDWTLVLACCARRLAGQERWELVRRLGLSRDERTGLVESGALWAKAVAAWQGLSDADRQRPSRIERTLRGIGPAALLVAFALSRREDVELAAAIRTHLETLRFVRARLSGDDLRELGLADGPAMGEMLDILRAARLDGEAGSAADERRLVTAFVTDKRLKQGVSGDSCD